MATSGDTGKRVEGFKMCRHEIYLFLPLGGVSKFRNGNDDQERKKHFRCRGKGTLMIVRVPERPYLAMRHRAYLAEKGIELSSANSINWGRLLPQIVYYLYTYANLLVTAKIQPGEKVNFVVPTGNFGNILAAWYASRMGVPVHKLICASNENNVLTDFFRSGEYEKNRPFKQTNSPSMDILISSNLERFLFEMSGRRGDLIAGWMKELQEHGRFAVGKSLREKMGQILWAGYATEEPLSPNKSNLCESGIRWIHIRQ